MAAKTKFKRFLAGTGIVVLILVAAFAMIIPWIYTWGATPEETAQTYRGDEILSTPIIVWTHAITINAPSARVWPWIIQMGDGRAGFYSYTFIENMVSGSNAYHNASQVVADWQNPSAGQVIITPMLAIKDYKAGEWELASSVIPDLGWTWMWQLTPLGTQGDQTRLQVRMRIQVPAGAASGTVVKNILHVGGFVMERAMMTGIKAHAEGRLPFAGSQVVEIVVWVLALGIGLASAWLFIFRPAWKLPLAVGILAVLALFVFTFLQPGIWLRMVVDLALIAGLDMGRRINRKRPAALPVKV
jgi:hypothetical protein